MQQQSKPLGRGMVREKKKKKKDEKKTEFLGLSRYTYFFEEFPLCIGKPWVATIYVLYIHTYVNVSTIHMSFVRPTHLEPSKGAAHATLQSHVYSVSEIMPHRATTCQMKFLGRKTYACR